MHNAPHEGEIESKTLPSSKRRLVSGPLRRALRQRDGGCRFPGCTQSRFVDAHHILHWAQGGETKMSNLVLLCRRHHSLIHEGKFRVCREEGDVVFRTRDGVRLPEITDLVPMDIAGELSADIDDSPDTSPDTSPDAWSELSLDASAEASVHPKMLTPKLDHKPPDYQYISSILLS